MLQQASQSDVIFCAHGAAAFQLLRGGVELGVFESLHTTPKQSLSRLAAAASIPLGSARVLLFGLNALNLVVQNGDTFSNVNAIEELLANDEWPVFRALVRFQAYIVYPGQVDYVASLIESTNVGTGRFTGDGDTLYKRLNDDKSLQAVFYEYMEAYSAYANPHLISSLDLSKARSVLDVGGGGAGNAIALAKTFPDIEITLLDLPIIAPIAEEKIKRHNLASRIRFEAADMHQHDFPKNQDAVLFIHQLMIWSTEQNKALLTKAYESLTPGGQVVIFGSVAEDDEKGPLMAALDTVYFSSVAAGNGMIYPWKDYEMLLREIGFTNIEKKRSETWTPHGLVLAQK
jgi:ubiquinone/menaquinone biosynthesis C-methylase UbiE